MKQFKIIPIISMTKNQGANMYRIQAYNFVKNHTFIYECSSSERAQLIQELLDTGNYRMAGISCEWLARCD